MVCAACWPSSSVILDSDLAKLYDVSVTRRSIFPARS
jgi:hypothetical protein